jgi:hypothetical protein
MRLLISLIVLLSTWTGVASVIPTELTQTVVFIYKGAECSAAQAEGTGFLMAMPTPDGKRSWAYLVTAKHVVHTDSNNFESPLFDSLWIRINTKTGGSKIYKVDLVAAGDKQDVFINEDASVDIAVVPLTISATDMPELELKVLPEQMLASTSDLKTLNIGVGTDMFFTGMFTGFLGEKKSYPIVRFGKLAMIPDEKIQFAGQWTEGYLMEAFSFGGNSGSPVFFYPSADNTPGIISVGSPSIKIAGVMKGFFNDFEQIQLLQNQAAVPGGPPIPVSTGNAGVALIVPAKFISEILHSPALEALRKKNP